MRLTIKITAGQRDVLQDLLYDQTQNPTVMDPGMARALYEEIGRANSARKVGADVGAAPK